LEERDILERFTEGIGLVLIVEEKLQSCHLNLLLEDQSIVKIVGEKEELKEENKLSSTLSPSI